MIGALQRILQLLVIAALAFAIYKPGLMPAPVRPVAYSASHWVFGPEVSWSSFSATWQNRWLFLTTYIPPLAKVAIPNTPPTITSQGVLNLIVKTLFVQPANKWETIKSNLTTPEASSSSGTGQ